MASTDNSNMSLSLGFKGSGKPNGVPMYVRDGVWTLGGVQLSSDAQLMKFGRVVCSDPAGDDGVFSVGAQVIAGVASKFRLNVTAACTTAGNINIDGTVIAVTTAASTAAAVAALIGAASFNRFTVSYTAGKTFIDFTAKGATLYSAPTLNFYSTGVTAVVVKAFALTVTHACSSNGNVTIDGVAVAVTTAASTAAAVAAVLAAGTFTNYTVDYTAGTAVVNFIAKLGTTTVAPTVDYASTGVTGAFAEITATGTVGSVPRGVVIYRPDIAMIDSSKPDYVLQGTPVTVAYFGDIWLGTWTKTATDAIDPVLGCVVIAKNDTGVIEFLAAGSSAPSGWYKLANCSVKSVDASTNGVMLFLNI